ncbi:DUF5133 domain-containing protein [Streptomyces cyaneofuscatus]|uniref:DUF5133 domain-containing protein n=1 Tax=Streptomyces cyaneofuscatus TaxID=66883 RepID=UPI00365023E1
MPRPETVRSLLARYNELQLEHSQDSVAELSRSLEDVSYTLCITTGTRTIQDALMAAEAILRVPSPRTPATVERHGRTERTDRPVRPADVPQPSAS